MNNKQLKVKEFLNELIAFRKREALDMLKYGFGETEVQKYQEKTLTLFQLIKDLDSLHDEKTAVCNTKQLSIDEAIAHAKEVAEASESNCAKNHLQLANWLSEYKDLISKYSYLSADFSNYKKRTATSEKISYDKGQETMLIEILGVYDDMERLCKLIKYADNDIAADKITKKDSGFLMIFNNIDKLLAKFNCVKIDCNVGDKFDVNTMEAISAKQMKDCKDKNDIVVEIFQTGWIFNNKVIRPAKVVIGKECTNSKET